MADAFVSRFGCYTIIWDTTARRQLKIKLSRYWARVSPARDQVALQEMDEESVRSSSTTASAYDIDPAVVLDT